MKDKKKIEKKRTLLQRTVNVFLYAGLVLLTIGLVFLGFSQTSTFRNYLRVKIINEANSALNGRINIGRIDGTIFTSLILSNTVVSMGNDTLLNAGTIEVKTSPLQIFLKKIYVRKFKISDAEIAFVKDSTGSLNISRLFPKSSPDTTSSEFPFKIILPDLSLHNVNLSLKGEGAASGETYDHLNTDDLKIKNLNLSLNASADIKNKEFDVEINDLSFSSNIKDFSLNKLSGRFIADTGGVFVKGLHVETNRTNINLDAAAGGFNAFDSAGFSKIDQAKLKVNLDADKFGFDDLSALLPSTSLLKGTVAAKLEAFGSLENLKIRKLVADYAESHFEAAGSIQDVDKPSTMYINVDFKNTSVKETDVNLLLPGISVPHYKNLAPVTFDSLKYRGNPLNFSSHIIASIGKGKLDLNARLNLMKTDMEYAVKFSTQNIDLDPVLGIATDLNSKGIINGSGVSPERINSTMKFHAEKSIIAGNRLDSLNISADARQKNIKYNLRLRSDTAIAYSDGTFNFENKDMPSYDLTGFVKNLNLAPLANDTSLQSNLNLHFDGSGENFSLDKINLFLSLNLDESILNGVPIDSARMVVDLRSNDNGERVINIISDLADITVIGNFSTKHAIDVTLNEGTLLASVFKRKIYNIMHPDSVFSRQLQNGVSVVTSSKKDTETYNRPMSFKYSVEFKDFSLLSMFLGNSQLKLNGNLDGEVKSEGDSLWVGLKSKLDYIKFWNNKDVFFLSNMNLDLNLKNPINDESFSRINSKLNINADRIFTGQDIRNLKFVIDLNNSLANINFAALIGNSASVDLGGVADLKGNSIGLNLYKLSAGYNKFAFQNNGNISIGYSADKISFNKFDLKRGNQEIGIDGSLDKNQPQDLKIRLRNFKGSDLTENVFGLTSENSLGSIIDLTASVKGTMAAPEMNIDFKADSITYREKDFGTLTSKLSYKNKKLDTDILFVNPFSNEKKPALKVSGYIPVDLAFTDVKNRFDNSKEINIALTAKDFNLAAFGNILPAVDRLTGIFSASIKLTGTPGNLSTSGYAYVRDASFVLQANNIQYNAGLKISLSKNMLSLDSLTVANISGTPDGGTMTGSGTAVMTNFDLSSFKIAMNGNLKVLSDASKAVSPSVYGDLVVATNGNLQFTTDESGTFLSAPIIVKKAKLTFPPTQTAYQNSANNFIYRFVADTTGDASKEMDFERLVQLARQRDSNGKTETEKKSNFNYNINVKVEKEASLRFILSKEINQNLTALIKGSFQYEKTGDRPNVQGELTLMEGSTLEFLKTFEATGTIRFESELNNPNLNITATYKDNYFPPDAENKPEQVAVKVYLKGPLNDLSKNFIQDKNNIQVYVGADNINNNTPDQSKDVSDAVMFILTGKFASDLNTQQQTQALTQSGTINPQTSALTGTATATATSLAGSLLGGFLNQYLGDYVRSVELRSIGSTTKFNLVGRVKDFRYSIGGSTDVFQDLSQANVKIEYPLYQNLLLRLERKDAITQTSISNEMVNELGLKYRFEF